jgi:hypothetical protein
VNTRPWGLALIAIFLPAGDVSAQVTGTPMVIWSRPQGPDGPEPTASKPAPRGPSAHQLTSALADQSGATKPHVRDVACGADSQEITRFDCAYEQQDSSGAWRRWSARVARDSGHWRVVSTPVPEL